MPPAASSSSCPSTRTSTATCSSSTTAGPATKFKVTWGAKSKDYTAAELAKGINLAADFLDNPFSEPFKKVEEAIRNQQNFETFLIKQLLPTMSEYARTLPEQKESLDKVAAGGIEKATALGVASRAAIAPVKHTIKIEKLP